MCSEKISEYRYMDELVKKNREITLKKILTNNIDESIQFYDLNLYEKKERKNSSITGSIYKSKLSDEIILNKFQVELLDILKDNNLFLSAPTSFGKTFVILEYIKRNISKLNNIVFIIPTLALMNELLKKIYNYFSEDYNICINSSEVFEEKNIFVFVPERSDFEFIGKIKDKDIDLLIFDEIYKLQPAKSSEIKSDDRLIYMNKVYLDLIKISKKVTLLGPYINNVAFENTKLDIVKYYTNFMPVYNSIKVLREESWTNYIKEEKQLIYFSSPGSIYKNINDIISNIPINEEIVEKYKKEIFYLETKISNKWYVTELLKRGVGIHHGKTPMFLRKFYENEYKFGNINILVCTNTLMEGINTPTESLIIVDDPGSAFKLNNLIGRVGRLNVNNPKIGEVIISKESIMDNVNNINEWMDLKILAEDQEIKSDDEILYLNKTHSDVNLKNNFDKKLELINKFDINTTDIISKNLQIDKVYTFLSNKIYKKFEDGNEFIDYVRATLDLIKAPSYFFSPKNFINIENFLPYKYYICDLLMGKSYKEIVDKFNYYYNKRNNIENINIFIDSLYELNNFIKFNFNKIVSYLELVKLENLKNENEFKKFIALVSSYKNLDCLHKIFDDLGIDEDDSKKIIQYLKIDSVSSTSKIIKLIKEHKDSILTLSLSPFTVNNIKSL